MESRVHDVIHGSFVGGKTNNSNTLKKRGPSGRKPLGDLSNSVKHTINQTSKKLNCDILPIQEEPSSSKVTGPREKKVAPASKKKASVGGRKALCDISNSAKPHLPEALRKVLKAPTRFGSLSEEPALHSIDSEKQFLHDHQECIKAQTHSMDLDEFLKVVGLHDVVDQPASPRLSELKVGKLNKLPQESRIWKK
ncbi:PREDICTED: uncharacterized protein LOC104819054 isoform X2 [Tarenaya hassleriana]|uniref:uncharacterized protein LOC104819054 isoform X2 n=1 Tax=Tarenaya hassleriana TaxID=28532 RepID=UPI0008FD09AE|nr:PREDICTED: uncharacterized protein LOC104819054 isoform X2 [Tarenaya hassleriana]